MENPQILYRNIISSVRSHRYALLINEGDIHWISYIRGAIRSFSQAWGGEYFIIVPTDGKTIDDVFWKLLEVYSPDYIGKYVPNTEDLGDYNPSKYTAWKERNRKKLKLSDEDFENVWNSLTAGNINPFNIERSLAEELNNRLAPFKFDNHFISQNTFHGSAPGFPFTHIEEIVDSANIKPMIVSEPPAIKDKYFDILALSRSGALTEKYSKELLGHGIETYPHPNMGSAFTAKDYIRAIESGEYNRDFHEVVNKQSDEPRNLPNERYFENLPFRLSMLHLSKYYRTDTHRHDEKEILVVIGDSVQDYCLYYSLSRMHEGTFWIPDKHLRSASKKMRSLSQHETDDTSEQFTEEEHIAHALVNEYFKQIDYGQGDGKIEICSISLGNRQLSSRIKHMASLCYFSSQRFSTKTFVKPIQTVSRDCVMRVIETNNHQNQQEMLFQNEHSVGKLNTPKPKNFNPVHPSGHRWITSLGIDNFHPPVIPELGQKIIELAHMNWETRVSNDGLAYLSPNIAYFGGDIDTVTVRPGLQLLTDEELFKEYFARSGIKTELSDKGSFLKDTIARFGSLELTANFFRSKLNRELFDQFLYEKDRQDSEVIILDTERRAYLSFEAFKRTLGDATSATSVIQELIQKDILRRGYIFQCTRCRLAAWYDIAVVDHAFTCSRCGLNQPYTIENWKMPAEPRWYYRLAETCYQYYKSSSHLTALALDNLRKEAPHNFHYISETVVHLTSGKKPKQEIDILAIVNGKIVLGECKDCIPPVADLKKYRGIINNLKNKPSRFLLATTEDQVSTPVLQELATYGNYSIYTKKDIYNLP